MKKFLSIVLTFSLIMTVLPFGLFSITTSAATSGYYTYTVIDGKATITDCNTSISGNITIPSTLGGYPVTNIGDYAFTTCDSLKSITVPNSVINIGEGAFSPCESLIKVTVSNGAISIGGGAFAGCYSLTEIIISDTVTSIGKSAFYDCRALKSIRLPYNITRIESQLFYGCFSLTDVTIPTSVTEIGRWAFDNCNNIKNVYYEGTSTQKQKISFGLSNNSLTSAKWHYEICTGTTKHIYDDICDTVCNVCNYERDYSHNFKWIIDKQATCVDTGIRHQECSVCYIRQNENSVINSTNNHTYDDVCDDDCNVCSAIRIPPHSFKWIVDKNATCGDTGIKHEECSLCYIKQNENEVIEATGAHIYDDVCDNECNVCKELRDAPHNYKWVVDTQEKCMENGIKHEECALCHTKRNENTIIEAPGVHVFDNICDTVCNKCGFIREVPEHNYGTDYTCDICKYSKKPDIPCIDTVSTNSVKLQSAVGCEYSKDGINWQSSPEFLGLESDTEYTFYQRVKASDNALVSESSEGITVTTVKVYYIRFEANGGIDVPDVQIKEIGVPIIVSSKKPTRVGYEFAGWGTIEKCGKQYMPGEEYTIDEDLTLYALWYEFDDCDNCKGTGKVNKNCGQCDGNGRYHERYCKGCGSSSIKTYVTGYGTYYECNNCGSGNTGLRYQDCYYCKYTGKIEVVCGVCNGTRGDVIKPIAPIIVSFNDTTVTLRKQEMSEYSKDGVNWQESNIFSNLLPGTEYTFYIRETSTDTTPFSPISLGATIKTDKSKQTLIPDTPTVQSFTANSITLNAVEGCEYSKDGVTWQTDNVFSGLLCGTEYTFYQRYKETATTYVGKSSEALATKTDKGIQSKPSAPTVSNRTHNSVILTMISGYEYSRDGINWQSSNMFTGLIPETNYIFYQRKAETDRYYASESSASITVKTSEKPQCNLGHIYDNSCDVDCNVCGDIREITHTYDNGCDTNCNVCGAVREIEHTYGNDHICDVCGYIDYIPGDITGDDKINSLDGLMLLRYLNGWNITIASPEAMDVNADGKVNSLDGLVLMRYLNGWNITLG